MSKVLVVEDNSVNLELLCEMLQLNDYEIVEARDGQEALARLNEVYPDIVLLDVNMPRMDGFAVIDRVRGNPRFLRLPVIAVTGYAMQEDLDKMLVAGFDSYVIKPINLKSLLAEMSRLIKSRTPGSGYETQPRLAG